MDSSDDVQLTVQDSHVVLDNGIVKVTLSKPEGIVTGIQYGGLDNVLEILNDEDNRGYWDLVWNHAGGRGIFDVIRGTEFSIVRQEEDNVELSFKRSWIPDKEGTLVPLNIDKRFVVLRGSSGFYTYAIYQRPEGWPEFEMGETRIAFKLRKDKFRYMAIADNRQRVMPLPDDRLPGRCQTLAYAEAVLLTNPVEEEFKGQVDDKYQYSCDNKDNKVHGWICNSPSVGFWMITPSDEFKNGGPMKQNLTSHVGPTTLSVFHSGHYAGDDLVPQFKDGESWEKVFGPVFIYLNSAINEDESYFLWEDAKRQMEIEVLSWPYSFPESPSYPKVQERGVIVGRLLVYDPYAKENTYPAKDAFVGLALPGDEGSWQRESKGYQFWSRTDDEGFFIILNVRSGAYNMYAWVMGVIGDYKSDNIITINSGDIINMGNIIYKPPRDGATIWEIGYPTRTAEGFYIPDPPPQYPNPLYVNHPDKFRQYGLWERYGELYPNEDLIYSVDSSNCKKDWFFEHVTRKNANGSYESTTWQIKFKLDNLIKDGKYKLRIAIASATLSVLQVRFNNENAIPAHFDTGRIGRDNSIARHGIHGLYWLFNIDVDSSWLCEGDNILFLRQAKSGSPFIGILYDYIRLESPISTNITP